MPIFVTEHENPGYERDPDNPWQYVDVLDLQRRRPHQVLYPYLIDGWLKRDVWTRQEALYLLAGYNPSSSAWDEPSDRAYLDHLTELALRYAGIHHPRYAQCACEFVALSNYSTGTSLEEKKSPEEWIAWAAGKGFEPYWLQSVSAPDLGNSPDTQDRGIRESTRKAVSTRERGDALSVVIDEVVTRLIGLGARISVASVMDGLKQLQNAGRCVVDVSGDGSGVIWDDGSGQQKTLKMQALKERLKRAGHIAKAR